RSEPFEQLLAEWTKSENPNLAAAAAIGVVRSVSWHPKDWRPDPALFAPPTARPFDRGGGWNPWGIELHQGNDTDRDAYDGFQRIAAGVGLGELMGTLESAVARVGAAPDNQSAVRAGIVADAIAWAVHRRELSAADGARFAAALRSWAAQPRFRTQNERVDSMTLHVRFVLRVLPRGDAERFGVWALTEPFRDSPERRRAAI